MPMPVLPLVGSTITIPGFSVPRSIASSTIAAPMRSFTELKGLYPSCLTATRAASPLVRRVSWTRGVLPTVAVTSAKMRVAGVVVFFRDTVDS